MSKKKIIDDTINYLKYYKEYSNYQVFSDELKILTDDPVFLLREVSIKEKDVIPEESGSEKESILSAGQEDPEVKIIKEKEFISEPVSVSEDWKNCSSLEEFEDLIKNCDKCRLLAGTRKQIVFGTGNPDADVVVVGEAPGADEDSQGKPFVGRAGKLLTDILKAINFTREEVYICNILKCRPPDNRNPEPGEIVNCEPYLFRQLEMIRPKLILAVGAFAAQTLLRSKEPLGKLRGKFHLYNGIKMMVTYHPAALLRNPNWKRPTWEDVQLFRKEYDLLIKN
ncbi:MAG TPA: uracil-DNA glycosylase [Ignavibacteria bacterium]|nr:uracil-DNA glycosylase [Ignavibacteria bacterium]HMR39655.1 uracil-DNA glycosylase [Ignavibacteria bacterium]